MIVTLAGLCAAIWVGMLTLRGGFWRADRRLPAAGEIAPPEAWPEVAAVTPARDEAATIARTVRGVLGGGYPGAISATVVDDGSSDGTAEAARRPAPPTRRWRS